MNKTPGFTPGIGIDGNPKPYFREGDKVKIQSESLNGYGVICGIASQHVIDMWLVKVQGRIIDYTVYPYSVCQLPHNWLKLVE